jgi:hypothetical protein
MIDPADVEVSIPRLLLSAIKSNDKLNINLLDYVDEELDKYKMLLSFDESSNNFILTLGEKEKYDGE